jgi:hypothetical protein
MSHLPFELSVAKPCQEQWSAMSGNAMARHCDACKKIVHNLATMTPAQIERIVFESQGALCGRITYRGDGSAVTLQGSHRAASLALYTLSAALAVAPASAFAQESADGAQRQAATVPPCNTISESRQLKGVVTDAEGALVVGADVTLLSSNEVLATTKSDEAGQFHFAIQPGEFQIQVVARGFSPVSKPVSFSNSSTGITEFSLRPGNVVTVQVTADSSESYTTMGVLSASYSHWYQRLVYRLRHPVAFAKYKLHRK